VFGLRSATILLFSPAAASLLVSLPGLVEDKDADVGEGADKSKDLYPAHLR
jgi:hypothetical protein